MATAQRLVIAGTDTDVGKTVVSALVVQGLDVLQRDGPRIHHHALRDLQQHIAGAQAVALQCVADLLRKLRPVKAAAREVDGDTRHIVARSAPGRHRT